MSQRMLLRGLACVCLVASSFLATAQTAGTIVTVERKADSADLIKRENVLVFEAGKRAPITVWRPFTGENARLQLLVLIDDSSASALGNQLSDLRNFVLSLPVTTEVGVAYMRNGGAAMAQAFTADHAEAAKTIRLPKSSVGGGSPFFTLSDVTRHWPTEEKSARREIVMITDGIDRYSDNIYSTMNPYVTAAISESQRAAVVVYTIYFRGAGTFGAPATGADQGFRLSGQSYLLQVARETGGKCYTQGNGNPVSLSPMLGDLAKTLGDQYELRFDSRAKPQKGLVGINLKVESPGVKLIAPERVAVSQ